MFRIGELTQGPHTVKAKDVNMGENKEKFLFVLWSSKTHNKKDKPQYIKISAQNFDGIGWNKYTKEFCPFNLLSQYSEARGPYQSNEEQFFVFSDKSPVLPEHVRGLLRKILKDIDINDSLYNTHSMRTGRSLDLFKAGVPIEIIKQLGRWKSSAIYKYLTYN